MTRSADGEIARILAARGPIGVLGPVAGWAPELRSTMDLLLGSTHPLALAWGPDFALLYNDAHVPGAGRKHPGGFGQPVKSVFPEIWDRIGPLLERVLRTGEPQGRRDDRLVLRRHGFTEETYWNYSFSPLHDARGRVVGVFIVSSETTRRVVGERRLRLLSRLAGAGRDTGSVDRAIEEVATVLQGAAADLPFTALYRYPADPAAPRLVAATGFGDRVPELPAPAGPGFAMVELRGGLSNARDVRATVAATAQVVDADGRPVVGVVLGVPPTLPFDADQRAFLQLVVGQVSTAVTAAPAAEPDPAGPEVRAYRFRAMADATPALIWVDDPAGERQFVNRGWLDFTGAAEASVELGRAWQDRIHPDDRQRYRSVRAAAAGAAAAFEVEYRLRHASGHHRWVLDRGAPVSPDEHPAGFVGGCLDVDAQHRERRRNQLFADVVTALDVEQTAAGRYRVLAGTLVEHGVADLVRVHEHPPGREPVVRAAAAADPAVEAELRAHDVDVEWHRQIVASGRARLVVAEEDHELDLGSAIFAPLTAGGRGLGLIAVGRTTAHPAYDAEDLELMAEIGRRAGVAVDNARLLEQERATSQRLALLHRATARMSAAATSQEVAAIAADHLATLLGCPFVGVWSAPGDGPLRLIATHGWTDRVPRSWDQLSRRADTPAVRAFRERRPVWIQDEGDWLATDRRTWSVVSDAGMVALGLIPLLVRDRCLGVIGVGFGTAHDFTDGERAAAVAAVELAAQALDRSDLFLAETTARRAAERFGAVATALSRAVDLAAVAAVAVTHARAAARAAAAVLLVPAENGQLVPMAAEGVEPATAELPVDADHVLRTAVRTGEPIWSAAADQDVHPVHAAVPLLVGGRAIGVVGFRFGDGDGAGVDEQRRSLVLTLLGQCAQAVARARLHQIEHEMAVTLQRSLLPQHTPELERLALATRYLPGTVGTEAGGDWFDVLELDAPAPESIAGGGERIALVVGDVVGRGPAAAAVMGQLRSALAANLVNGQSPAGALEQLDLYARRVDGARASTVACAVIDLETGELRYACAGHPPPVVVDRDGAVRLLTDGRGTPLGVTGRPPYAEAADRLDPGTTILLCSDGLFERRDEVVDVGLDRLAGVLAGLHGPPEEVADDLLDRMLAGRSVPDDVAFVLARVLPGPLELRLPAAPEQLGTLRRAVAGWADAVGMGEDGVTDLQLAVGEAATNAVEHAYRGREPAFVRVELARAPVGAIDVRVGDAGRWRPPPVDPGFRGRGLSLIRDIAEDVAVEPGPDGTTVRFRMPAVPVDAPPRPTRPARAAAPPPAPPRAGAALHRRTGPDGVRLEIEGDLDLAGVADVRAELLAELDRSGPVTLELARDCWISSAGVALLAELARRARRPLRVITAEGSPARRMLSLAGLDQVLDAC